jgi:hypothetical protein
MQLRNFIVSPEAATPAKTGSITKQSDSENQTEGDYQMRVA